MAKTVNVRRDSSERKHKTRSSTYSAASFSKTKDKGRNTVESGSGRRVSKPRDNGKAKIASSKARPGKAGNTSNNIGDEDNDSDCMIINAPSVKAMKSEEGDGVKTANKKKKTKKQTSDLGEQGKVQHQQDEEVRLRKYRPRPPTSFLAVQERAMNQRMFVIERARCGTEYCPEENFEIAGTTGNVYSVQIGRQPSCNCPHALKGNQCKHVIYILARVLKAPRELVYQLALLPTELRKIFARAPASPSTSSSPSSFNNNEQSKSQSPSSTNRKPIDADSDCPICAMPLLANQSENADGKEDDQEEIVFCRSSCGNNIHKVCFDTWAVVKRDSSISNSGIMNGQFKVPCPFCRAPWDVNLDCDKITLEKARKAVISSREMAMGGGDDIGAVSEEGYVNVARELGIDGQRDYSMYYQPWVRWATRRGYRI